MDKIIEILTTNGVDKQKSELFGKYYHFKKDNFVNFFAIFTLDFTPILMVK